ncbi:hypothetical protein OAT24_02810 [Gammaproteobacteria bacterium]|nr:hypothetical protein [Gammaproteobacteria bacterium]
MLKFINLQNFGIALIAIIFSLPLWLNTNLFDDAYIHARIVRNWIDFGFPSFLIGQDFKASSSTGYISVIYFLSQFLNILDAMVFIQTLSIFLFVFASAKIILTFEGSHKLLTSLIICTALPYFLTAAYGGMESSLILPLLLIYFIADNRNYIFIAMGAVAITVTLRFEMLSLLLPLAAYYSLEKKFKEVFLVLFFILLFFLMEKFLYGSIIPYASIAKSVGYNIPFLESFLSAISLNAGIQGPHLGILISFLLVYSLYQFFKILYEQNKIDTLWIKKISFILASVSIIFSWIMGGSNIFKWYLIPVCSLALVFTLLIFQTKHSGNTNTLKVLSIVMMLAFGNIGGMSFISNQGFMKESQNNRTYEYKKIGDFLYQLCPDCTLATSEIGALGWSFRGTVYDGFGLTDPEALPFHPLKVPSERSDYGIGAIPPKYITHRNPDFIVSLPIFIELFLKTPNKNYYKYNCKTKSEYLGDKRIIVLSKIEFNLVGADSIKCVPTT